MLGRKISNSKLGGKSEHIWQKRNQRSADIITNHKLVVPYCLRVIEAKPSVRNGGRIYHLQLES